MLVIIEALGSTTGQAYILDETTQKSVTMPFSAPAGTTLVGSSVEWILERPFVGGTLSQLQNYVTDFVGNAIASENNSSGTAYYSGYSSSGVTSNAITMLDNSKKPISLPVYAGINIFAVQSTGSAR